MHADSPVFRSFMQFCKFACSFDADAAKDSHSNIYESEEYTQNIFTINNTCVCVAAAEQRTTAHSHVRCTRVCAISKNCMIEKKCSATGCNKN